jgi:hypothetical protein
MSIGTPALSKNGMAIGSSTSFATAFIDSHHYPSAGIQVDPSSVGYNGTTLVLDITQAPYSLDLLELDSVVRPVHVANPVDACHELSDSVTGAIVLIDLSLGNCSKYDRAKFAQLKGAAIVLLIGGTEANVEFHETVDAAARLLVPVLGLSRFAGHSLIDNARNLTLSILAPAFKDKELQEKRHVGFVSDFSSRGPTIDGRLKPDILAPGE